MMVIAGLNLYNYNDDSCLMNDIVGIMILSYNMSRIIFLYVIN